MHFLARSVAGFKYYWRYYAVMTGLATLLSAVGLLIASGLTFDRLAITGIKQRLQWFGPSSTEAKALQQLMATIQHEIERSYQQLILWTLVIGSLLWLVAELWLWRKRRREVASLFLVGKNSAAVAGQFTIESLISVGLGYLSAAVILSFASAPLITWLNDWNRAQFTHLLGTHLHLGSTDIAFMTLFQHRLTGFTRTSLFAYDIPPQSSVAGFVPVLAVMVIGIGLIVWLAIALTSAWQHRHSPDKEA